MRKKSMGDLMRNSRFYILIFSGLLSISLYFYVIAQYQSAQLQIIRLTQLYAFSAVTFLYFALLVGPLSRFINGPFIQNWLHARRALGVSAFLFAWLHAGFAFFGQLGGFAGLPFLSNHYVLGISFSFIALLILTMMASTAFDKVVAKMKFKKWKRLHQLVYVAGIFILIHSLMLGTHFHDLSEWIPFVMFVAVTFLFVLHALCWEKRLKNTFEYLPKFSLLSLAVIGVMSFFYLTYMSPQNSDEGGSPLSVHSQHTLSQTTNTSDVAKNNLYMPGMEGDRTKRFNVEFMYPPSVVAGQSTKLDFKITDAGNGDPVYFFQTPFEKPFHLIIVNNDLSYFSHIHPVQQGNTFTIDTTFPESNQYRLYSDFQPFGAIEQQYGFQLNIGNENISESEEKVVYQKEKQVDNYVVKLAFDQQLDSRKVTNGEQELRFSIFDMNNNPVTNLHPYLGAFGHLVMIKKDTFEYVHAHPVMTKPVRPEERSGPEVQFVPMALYGTVTPGIYKVFGQFNPNGELITADFWIEVK